MGKRIVKTLYLPYTCFRLQQNVLLDHTDSVKVFVEGLIVFAQPEYWRIVQF